MLRAVVAAGVLATAYCGAKGPPQPPAHEAPDAGAPSTSTSPSTPSSSPTSTPTQPPTDAGSP